MNIDFTTMSDSDINIKLKAMEDDYETTKNKVGELVYHMKELNELYDKGKKILNKRTKGKVINGSTTLENR